MTAASAILRARCACHPRHRHRCSLCARVDLAVAEYVALVELGATVADPIDGVAASSSLYPINALTGRPA